MTAMVVVAGSRQTLVFKDTDTYCKSMSDLVRILFKLSHQCKHKHSIIHDCWYFTADIGSSRITEHPSPCREC